ncbi:vWA domain-containing protein [Actinomadura miaoliensis]|uniref:VWA domain-containing protein n=1 Tax=Actinomadura miaoliensis TaxID=430685 RepID=A0ABP7W4R7_9ACTN
MTEETHADLIACEDALMFVNAAITSTGQREFHHDAGEQRLSLDFLHAYMLANYREVYAAALALDVNDHNAVMIIRNLLAHAAEVGPQRRRIEGRLIARRLELLPPQRVYRLFRQVRRAGINNRRVRAIFRDWLAARPDLAFDAVKYRGAVKDAARHAHLPLSGELGDFLFRPRSRKSFRTPVFETWRRAHYEQAAVYELPYTVAQGFAARHGIPHEVFLERIAPKLTRLERLRLQTSARVHKADAVRADLRTMPLTRLASYVLSLPMDERAERRAELTDALRAAARRVAGARAWGRVAAVLDDSYSTVGSGEKRRRPLAVALACHYLLEALATDYRPLWTSGRTDPLLLYPHGPTPLGERVLDALDVLAAPAPHPGTEAPDRLVIVSDGWDNDPPGLAAEVLRVWRTRLDPDGRVEITHLNPVYDADDFDVRRLSPAVPAVGVRDAEDLPLLVELARFSEGRLGLAELRAHLDEQVESFLEKT